VCDRASGGEGLQAEKRGVIWDGEQSQHRLVGVDGGEEESGKVIYCLLSMEVRTTKKVSEPSLSSKKKNYFAQRMSLPISEFLYLAKDKAINLVDVFKTIRITT
jgi:hypothetical protein